MSKRRNIYGRVSNTKRRDGKQPDLMGTTPLASLGIDTINRAQGNSASIPTIHIILTTELQQPELVRIRAYRKAQEMITLS